MQTRPKIRVPAGACDTHMHIYDDRYPPSEKAWLFPENFLVEDYRKVQAALGLERTVIVQPVTYGFDNRCTLDAVRAFGDAARAVVTVPTTTTDEQLADYWDQGARGLRFHQMRGGMMHWDELPMVATRIKATDWHVQVQLDGMELPRYEALIADLPCTVVIDHMGRYSGQVDTAHPAFQSLLRLARRENVFVKLSGAYHVSRQGKPDYRDTWPLGRALVEVSTERLLWGSDWPHPTEDEATMPDEGRLLDLLADFGLTEHGVAAVLSHNPARLYGF